MEPTVGGRSGRMEWTVGGKKIQEEEGEEEGEEGKRIYGARVMGSIPLFISP